MARRDKLDGRAERSARTRARIVDAATSLFVENGYTATTIEEVAEVAGVAVQTVYYLFGAKRNLLSRVLDASVAGDLEPVPIVERPWVEALRKESDATAAMESLVEQSVRIVARATPVYEVIRRASAHPDVGDLLEANRRGRRDAQREVVEILHDAGHLAPNVDLDTAADVFYALLNEEVFQLLVGDCGWTAERFRRWATDLLVQQLFGADVAGP